MTTQTQAPGAEAIDRATNEARHALKETRRREKVPRGGPLMTLGTWIRYHERSIVGAPSSLLRATESELTERIRRAEEQPDNARTRAKTRWLARWLARVRGEILRSRAYHGGVPIEALDAEAPGPSARFPRLSGAFPIFAVDLVGETVSGWLSRILPLAELEEIGCRHVLSRYDLRVGHEAVWCSRCGCRTEVGVPSVDASRYFFPRLTPPEAASYARSILDFVRAHATCRPHGSGVAAVLGHAVTLAERSLP